MRDSNITNSNIYIAAVAIHDSSLDSLVLRSNAQFDTITITSLTLWGASTNFVLRSIAPTKAAPIVLPPHDSIVIAYAFTPSDTGIQQCSLLATSNASDFRLDIQARGLPAVAVSEREYGPDGVTLSAAYPNPFSNSTAFTVHVNNPQRASLKIFDVMGRVVDDLTPQLKLSGGNVATLNAGSLPNGVYVCRLSDGGVAISRTVVVAR